MNLIDLDILIMEMCEENEIVDGQTLSVFSQELHNTIERAIQDYALDYDLENDYEAQF